MRLEREKVQHGAQVGALRYTQRKQHKTPRVPQVALAPLRPLDREGFVWPTMDDVVQAQQTVQAPKEVVMDTTKGCLTKNNCIWIPPEAMELRQRILIVAHCGSMGHRGADAMRLHLKRLFWISNLSSEIQDFLKTCVLCPHVKGGRIIQRPHSQLWHARQPNEGLHFDYLYLGKAVVEVRGGRPGAADWEVGLGADTQNAAKFVKGEHSWQSGAWLPFSLTIDAQGNAALTYGGTSLQYAATTAGPIGLGNAVRVYVKASGTTPPSSVAVRVVRINDHSGLSQAVNTAPNSTVFNDASLALSYPASATSLRVDGEVQLNFVGTVPSGSRLGVTVTTGNCN